MIWFLNWLRNRSQAKVRHAADMMLMCEGDQGFFRCQEKAWFAESCGDAGEARFWRSVCIEISRRLQREQLLRRLTGVSPDAV